MQGRFELSVLCHKYCVALKVSLTVYMCLLLSAGVGIEPIQLSHVQFSAMTAVTGVIPYPTVFVILEMIARTTQSASRRLQVLHMVNLLARLAISQDAAMQGSSVPALLPVLGAVVSSSKAAAQTHWDSCTDVRQSDFWTTILMLAEGGKLIDAAAGILGDGARGTATSACVGSGEEQQQQQEQERQEGEEQDSTDRHKQQGGGGRLGAQSKQLQQVAWCCLEAAAQQWLREMCPGLSLDDAGGQQSLIMKCDLKEQFWFFLWAGLHLVCQAAGWCTGEAFSRRAMDLLGRGISAVEKILQCTLAKAAAALGVQSGPVLQAMEELQEGGAESLKCLARMVLSMVPVGFCCNNPDCRELAGLSELGLVQGPEGARGVCGGCGLACYCSRECQEKVWGAHRQVCEESV